MPKLICRVELLKESGIIITVINNEGKITQTITMDGTSIITKCQGEQETSTITQKSDSIAINCKTFTLDAETITCKSTKDTLHQSSQKINLESTQDMTLASSAKIIESATTDFSMSGNNVSMSAEVKAEISAVTAKISATGAFEALGSTVKVEGQASGELSASAVDVKATGMLTLESSGITKLKGSLTNIEGSLVKIG